MKILVQNLYQSLFYSTKFTIWNILTWKWSWTLFSMLKPVETGFMFHSKWINFYPLRYHPWQYLWCIRVGLVQRWIQTDLLLGNILTHWLFLSYLAAQANGILYWPKRWHVCLAALSTFWAVCGDRQTKNTKSIRNTKDKHRILDWKSCRCLCHVYVV